MVAPDQPYRVKFTLTGTKPILLHAYKADAVALKANAAKGSKTKKEDQPEDYVYRNEDGNLSIPGLNIRHGKA